MIGLRVASLAVLALWVGGLATLGFVVAPTVFATLEHADPAGGRTLAGLVFGAAFNRFLYISLAMGGLSIGLLILRALLGPRPLRLAWRVWTVVGMVAFTAVTIFIISPRIDRLRRDTPGTMAALADSDPRKAEFGRLHGLSNVLMLATLVGGVGLIWMEARDT
jgi:hypothetical protein